MTRDVTPEMVTGLWSHLGTRYRTQVIDKASADEMKLVSRALAQMGILDADRFMERYTTTIGLSIYTPFEVGVEEGRFTLERQLHIGVHEHKHAKQYIDGEVRFMLEYIGDPARRAHYEAQAMTVNLELDYWLGRTDPRIDGRTAHLVDYAIGEKDRDTVRKHLNMIWKVASKGYVLSDVGRESIGWLDQKVIRPDGSTTTYE